MNKQNTFNDFRFEGLDYKKASNKYLTMKRTKTLKLARRMIGYKITYDASKHSFTPEVTSASSISKCDIIDVPDLNLLYFTQAEAMENLTKKIVEHIIGKKPDLTLYECLELLSKKTDEKYVWKFVVCEYFSYVGNINNKRRRLIGYL